MSNRVLVETDFEASKTLVFKGHFGASKIVLTKTRLLKRDFPVHGSPLVSDQRDLQRQIWQKGAIECYG